MSLTAKSGSLRALAMLLIAFSMLSGCATIVGSPDQEILIESDPSGAELRVIDERGTTVHTGQTPSLIRLNKSDGSYWGGQRYLIHLSKPGHRGRQIALVARPNAWYLGGNAIFGGLIGWFLVDPFSGNMYTLVPALNGDEGSPAAADETIEREHISVRLEREEAD